MFKYETLWDFYKVKFLFLLISFVVAIILSNYLYNHDKDKKMIEFHKTFIKKYYGE